MMRNSLFTILMKKIIFYISVGISIILLINIINILVNDLNRLTNYGHGYLVGKGILFAIFIIVILITRKHKIKAKTEL